MPIDNPEPPKLTDDEKAARRAKNAANRARREAKAAGRIGKGPGGAAPLQDESRVERSARWPMSGKKLQPAEQPVPQPFQTLPKVQPSPSPAPAPSPVGPAQQFNILIVAQAGRLEYEALLFAESLRVNSPGFTGRLIVAEPRPIRAWAGSQTEVSSGTRAALEARGAEITPFTARYFGAAYPYGNKIEALSLLPPNEPFVFFDTDTLILGPVETVPFDFSRPSASMRREGTWPEPPPYGPSLSDIWKSLYDRFGLDYASSLDLSKNDDHWQRYLYFNAGWFFGSDPVEFGHRFSEWSREIRSDPGTALAAQKLDPWLDQITLPLVIHSFGGGRPGPALSGLDGDVTCHWRNLPLLYARESDRAVEVAQKAAHAADIRPLLANWPPADTLIYSGAGLSTLRPAFDRACLPQREQALRKVIRNSGWWIV